MEGRAKRAPMAAVPRSNAAEVKTPPPLQPNIGKGYFTVESFLVLLCLTASLLILPLVLPPLPPPPLLLLVVPIGIMAVLLVLALMPSDARDIASPYL